MKKTQIGQTFCLMWLLSLSFGGSSSYKPLCSASAASPAPRRPLGGKFATLSCSSGMHSFALRQHVGCCQQHFAAISEEAESAPSGTGDKMEDGGCQRRHMHETSNLQGKITSCALRIFTPSNVHHPRAHWGLLLDSLCLLPASYLLPSNPLI